MIAAMSCYLFYFLMPGHMQGLCSVLGVRYSCHYEAISSGFVFHCVFNFCIHLGLWKRLKNRIKTPCVYLLSFPWSHMILKAIIDSLALDKPQIFLQFYR